MSKDIIRKTIDAWIANNPNATPTQISIQREAIQDAHVREQRIKSEQIWDEEQPEWFQMKFKIGKFKVQG